MNSRKKRFVNPIKIEVTRKARTEMILGKYLAIFNGHQPPRADDPYNMWSKECWSKIHFGLKNVWIKEITHITHDDHAR